MFRTDWWWIRVEFFTKWSWEIAHLAGFYYKNYVVVLLKRVFVLTVFCIVCTVYFYFVSFMYIYRSFFYVYYCKEYCNRVITLLQVMIIIIIIIKIISHFLVFSPYWQVVCKYFGTLCCYIVKPGSGRSISTTSIFVNEFKSDDSNSFRLQHITKI
jgi:hypothetical protein